MKIILLSLYFALAWAGTAHAGPLALAWTAVTTFAASNVFVGALLKTVIGMGLSALARTLMPQQKAKQAGITTESTTQGETTDQSFIIGRYATEGHLNCPPMVFQTDDDPNEWLTYVIELSDRPITGINAMWIEGKRVTFAASPMNPSDNTIGVTVTDEYKDYAWVRVHDGNQTAADAFLMRMFATYPERPWSSDMILRGVAYAVITFKGRPKDKVYAGGLPTVRFDVNGMPLKDPRNNHTGFSANAMVLAWNVVKGIPMANGDIWGYNIPEERIVRANAIAAINACDQLVDIGNDQTERRYRAGLEIKVSDEPADVLQKLLDACGGDFADMGGEVILAAGPPTPAVMHITDGDIIVTSDEDFDPFPGLDATINAIHASYPDVNKEWETTEATPLFNAEWEKFDGRRLPADIQLPAVPYARQVRRLMREMAADARRMRNHVVTLPPEYAGVRLLEDIAWTSPRNGYEAKLFEVRQKAIDPVTDCVTFSLRERDPNDYNPDAFLDGVIPSPVSPGVVTPVITGIAGFLVTAITIYGDNNTARPGIRIDWNGNSRADGVAWQIQRVAGTTTADTGSTTDVSSGFVIISNGLIGATAYRVRARQIIRGRTTAWSAWQTVTTPNVGVSINEVVDDVADLFREQGLYAISYVDSLPTSGAFDGQLVFNRADGKLYRWQVSPAPARWRAVVEDALNGVLTETAFAQGISIPRVVNALPTTDNFQGRMVILSTNGKIYRYHNRAWTTAVPSVDLVGQLTSDQIAELNAAKIAGQITGPQIAPESINSTKITDNAVITRTVNALAINANAIAANAVEAAKISAAAVIAGKLAADAVLANNISANAVTTRSLATNSVTTDALAANSVTANQLTANSVTTAKIAAGAVATDQLAANAVIASKMAITDFSNLVPDDQMQDPAAWSGSGASHVTHFPNSSGLGSKGLFQIAPAGSVVTTLISKTSAAKAGERYFCQGNIWSRGNARVLVVMQFLDADNGHLASVSIGDSTETGSRTFKGSGQAPVGTAQVRMYYRIPEASYGGDVTNVGGPVIRIMGRGELIVDGTITGNKIVANTITAGLLAASGVIATAAQITNGVITNAHLTNASVTTLKIGDNAVIVPVVASAVAAINLAAAGSWVNILSISLTRQGAPTFIMATVQMGGFGASLASYRLMRNGTTVGSVYPMVSGLTGTQTSGAFAVLDTELGTGSTTYTIQAQRINEGQYTDMPQINARTMIVLHVKR